MENKSTKTPAAFTSLVEPAEDYAAGTKLKDRYLLIERLGVKSGKSVGAFGLVFLAEDLEENHRKVVVKILKDEWLNTPYIKKHFFQETEAMNRIHHDGVISVLKSGAEDNGRPFFVIAYAEGQTLREILQAEVLELSRVVNLIKEISYALDAVHRANVLHRDLKPENIIISQKANQPERIKIIDFGAALVKNSTVAKSTVFAEKKAIGTPTYASPEQIRSEETYAGEVFSLAAIAYEMLTGRTAFPAGSFAAVKELHLQGVKEKPSQLRPELSADVDDVVSRGLALNPADRFQTPIEFAAALESAVFTSKPAPQPLRKIFLILAAGCLLITLAGLVYYISSADTRQPQKIIEVSQSSSKIEGNNAGAANKFSNTASNTPNNEIISAANNLLPLAKAPADVLNISLTRIRDTKIEKVNGNGVFEKEDGIRINIKAAETGFLYIFNKGSDGRSELLFPNQATNDRDNEISAAEPLTIPKENWIGFNKKSGVERVYIVFTKVNDNPVGALTPGKRPLQDANPQEVIKYLDKVRPDSQNIFTTDNGNVVRIISLKHR